MIGVNTKRNNSQENKMPQKLDKCNMAFWHLLSLKLLINERIHDVVPKRCERQIESFNESNRKFWHFVVEVKSGKVLIGVHMVVGVPLEPEDDPIVNHIIGSVPRGKLTDLLLIDILSEY